MLLKRRDERVAKRPRICRCRRVRGDAEVEAALDGDKDSLVVCGELKQSTAGLRLKK